MAESHPSHTHSHGNAHAHASEWRKPSEERSQSLGTVNQSIDIDTFEDEVIDSPQHAATQSTIDRIHQLLERNQQVTLLHLPSEEETGSTLPALQVSSQTETETQSQQPTSLWSLPLPPRQRTSESGSSNTQVPAIHAPVSPGVAHLSLPAVAEVRERLIALNLPPGEIDATLMSYDASAFGVGRVTSISVWLDRVMDRMYQQQRLQQADSSKETINQSDESIWSHPIKSSMKTAATSLSNEIPTTATSVAPSPVGTCGICFDPILDSSSHSSASDKFDPPHCLHAFCDSCWNGYLSTKVLANQVLFVRCPAVNPQPCKRRLSAEEIHSRLLSGDIKHKFLQQEQMAIVARDPDRTFCVTPNCNGIVHRNSDSSNSHVTCDICHKEMCFRCNTKWHPNQSCDEASSEAVGVLLESIGHGIDMKFCPQCHEGIERSEGCNFVRCSRCHYEFCWLCLSHYSDSHYAWWNLRGCPLMHLRNFGWCGDQDCFCCSCPCIGTCKRGMVRAFLFFVYFILFLIAAPFLLVLSPYLLYKYCVGAESRAKKQELRELNQQMTARQMARAKLGAAADHDHP